MPFDDNLIVCANLIEGPALFLEKLVFSVIKKQTPDSQYYDY